MTALFCSRCGKPNEPGNRIDSGRNVCFRCRKQAAAHVQPVPVVAGRVFIGGELVE